MSPAVTTPADPAIIRRYARAAQWDPHPRLLHSEADGAEFPWIAMWLKKGALKVASGGPTPDAAIYAAHVHAAKLLGVPRGT